jgi:catechol 2,3-dioxygenase-like lactoylglutathione lyase family enzyme
VASAYHHVGLQVASIEAAAQFYIDSFDGRWLTKPMLADDPKQGEVMDGPPETAYRHCKIGFDRGAVELFEFVGPNRPAWATLGSKRRLPHFGMIVDDVDATLERVRAAGGKELWPAVTSWGDARNMYVADVDGNVIEVIDAPLEEVVATTIRLFPEADPGA